MSLIFILFFLTFSQDLLGSFHEDLLIYDPTDLQLQEMEHHSMDQTQIYETAFQELQSLQGIEYAHKKGVCLGLKEIAQLEQKRYKLYIQTRELKALKHPWGHKNEENIRTNRINIIRINSILKRSHLPLEKDLENSLRFLKRNPSLLEDQHFAFCYERRKLLELESVPSPQEICTLLRNLSIKEEITPENAYEKFNSLTNQQLRDHVRNVWQLSFFERLYENQEIFETYKNDFKWL